MFYYTAYGLHIQSSLELPELIIDDQSEPDVNIHYGNVGREFRRTGKITYLRATPQEVCLTWKDAGVLLVRDGNELIVDPQPGVDERILRLFILGAGFAVLFQQQGRLALHASGVVMDDQVVAFIGKSGWGKSTLAGALHARGHYMLADDLVVVEMQNDRPIVVPGFPQLKLWPDALEAIGADPQLFPQIRVEIEKRSQLTHDSFSIVPQPLGAIYVLAVGDDAGIEPLSPAAATIELVRTLFISGFGTRFAQKTQDSITFLQCADLAKRVPVRLLWRPNDLTAVPRLAELIENDFRQLQPASSPYGA